MKKKALLLSALILAPTAAATTQAQDFRVRYVTAVSASPNTFPVASAKSNVLEALSDAELDEIQGEVAPIVIAQTAVKILWPVVAGAVMGYAGQFIIDKVGGK